MAFGFGRLPAGGRLFDVECECGEEFRVPVDTSDAGARSDRGLLVRLEGSCPWCGLRLEEIDPLGVAARPGLRTPPAA